MGQIAEPLIEVKAVPNEKVVIIHLEPNEVDVELLEIGAAASDQGAYLDRRWLQRCQAPLQIAKRDSAMDDVFDKHNVSPCNIGFDVCIVTSATNNDDARILLAELGMPFRGMDKASIAAKEKAAAEAAAGSAA